MNYYNPYFVPYSNIVPPKTGLFTKLLGGKSLNLSSILSGTGKVINFANQAIPLVKQIEPVVQNAKTMFRVMNEFKKIDMPSETKDNKIEKKEAVTTTSNNVGPTFFL